ncbi:beta-N-acetylhexosaminidase [Fictibacillus sp. 23RED33]|uniref:beta-N-acetylhexosaminidase n=1 Tax=Fictibacillus sp. 23RED33 TaxID=2745879 RepID=UPI0018CCD350|nr:beta-N-acetylhexosaminidase [Fictibacillus sp. 23RED33]MBH0175737.1 beta-N-acetylhexosaminidase [Fictibacillus sp. 23RED33]
MKKSIYYSLTIIVALLLNGCGLQNNPNQEGKHPLKQTNSSEPLHVKQESRTDPIKEQIKHMTLEEKIGQMIVSGIEGTSMTTNTKELVNKYKVGGVILFRPNVSSANQLVTFTNDLKRQNKSNKVPLFVSVDQEGGRVNRMPLSVINTPKGREIGRINREKYSYGIGNVIAKELRLFGFNVDFAPVLDIQSNKYNTVIGDRSFGSDSSIVSRLGISMMKGIHDGNVIPVVKHFPGHGDTSTDSHLDLPVVKHDMSRLKKVELVPFNKAIQNNADMIMVAHILVKNLDKNYPASMSKAVMSDLLRKQMGYKGIVISDDMTMGAIMKHYSLKKAVVRSVQSGNDIILIGHGKQNTITAINALKQAVGNHQLSENTIDQSVYRILSLKNKYKLQDKSTPFVDVPRLNANIRAAIK